MSKDNPLHILIVDDDLGVREMLKTFFEDQEFEVVVAANGTEALKQIDSDSFEMVISDLRMPEVDGLEVIQHYKSKNSQGIGIIITGLATVESAIDALRTGIDDFVLKPFNLAHLNDIIDKHLELRRVQAENKRLQEQVRHERDELKKTVTVLQIIKDIALKLNYNFSFSDLIQLVIKHIARVVNYDYAVYADTANWVIFAHSNSRLSKLQKSALSEYTQQFLKQNYQLGDEVESYELISAETADHNDPLPAIHSELAIELSLEGGQKGIILALGCKPQQFEDVDSDFLEELSVDVTKIFSQFWSLLTEQKHRIQLLVDHITDGVILIDVFADEIVFNPAAAEILGRHSSDFSLNSLLQFLGFSLEDVRNECIKNDAILQEMVDIEVDDRHLVLDVRINGFKYAGYLEEGLVLAVRDITAKFQVERMKENLIANVSHELKTPIAIVKEYLSLMEEGIGGEINEQQQEFIDIAKSHLERLTRLIYNFINMSKLDSGQLYIKPKQENVRELIDETLEHLHFRMEQKHIALELEGEEELPKIEVDRDAFLQVLMNLLDNAIKYSPENGKIRVGANTENSGIKVWVKDEGKGIKEENLDKIFQRFFQELWDENKPPGTGLGLSITRQLVEEHGGRIWAESPDGQGAHMYFYLPATRPSHDQTDAGKEVTLE